MSLADLTDFGRADAERDFDDRYFLHSTAWTSVRRRERPIVIGRKGAGKTAIRVALLSETISEPELFVSHLSLANYPWTAHQEFADVEVGPKGRYLEGWTF